MARHFTASSSQYFGASLALGLPYSVHAHIKTSPTRGINQAIFCVAKAAGGNADLMYLTSADQLAIFTAGSGSGQSVTSAGSIATGTTYKVGAIVDVGFRNTYLNGVAGTSNTTDPGGRTTDIVRVGAYYNAGLIPDFYADCDISDMAIWNVRLNDSEFAALAFGASPLLIRPTALVHYWPFLARASNEENWVGSAVLTQTNGPIAVADGQRLVRPSRHVLPIAAVAAAGGFFARPYYDMIGQQRMGA
jgi:hypothetical protein